MWVMGWRSLKTPALDCTCTVSSIIHCKLARLQGFREVCNHLVAGLWIIWKHVVIICTSFYLVQPKETDISFSGALKCMWRERAPGIRSLGFFNLTLSEKHFAALLSYCCQLRSLYIGSRYLFRSGKLRSIRYSLYNPNVESFGEWRPDLCVKKAVENVKFTYSYNSLIYVCEKEENPTLSRKV